MKIADQSHINSLFSVIVPTHRRESQLRACLWGLSQLQYPRSRFEVIVVDDGGHRSLQPLIARFRTNLNISLISQDWRGPAAARNAGAHVAQGDLLAFTDDDCVPAADWLDRLATHSQQLPEHAIGGRLLNGLPGNIYARASQAIVDQLFHYYNAEPRKAHLLLSSNIALPAPLYQQIGGFSTAFPIAGGEDRDFCRRWLSQDLKLSFVPDIIVYHYHDLNLRSFLRQHFNYGRGSWLYHLRRARRDGDREASRTAPLSFYSRLVGYPLRTQSLAQGVPVAALLVLAQLATGIGVGREFFHRARRSAPIVRCR